MGMLDASIGWYEQLSSGQQSLLGYTLAPLSLYVVWYLWRFTIVPALCPSDPKPLPYYIPFLGCVYWFATDQQGLINYGCKSFGTRPFAVTIMGKTLYFIPNLADINAMYKAPSTISFDEATVEVFEMWGMSKDGLATMFRKGGWEGKFPNPHSKSLANIARDITRSQLESQATLKELASDFAECLDPFLTSGAVPTQSLIESKGDSLTVDLLKLCQWTLIPAGADTFFGKGYRKLHEDYTQTFATFDLEAGKILMQLPEALAKDAYRTRRELLAGMKKWVQEPEGERGDASVLMKTFLFEMKAAGMPLDGIALLAFFQNWLFNVNTFKLSFWVITYILDNPTVHASVLTELKEGGNVDSAPDADFLLNSCPLLNAVFEETQRLTLAAFSSRNVTEDTVLNGWQFRKGGKLLVPYRVLHFQSSVFGDKVNEFDGSRFLKKDLNRSPSYKPFGGGNTLCTGRHMARREVLIFVCMLLSRWDLRKESEGVPEFNLVKPSLGTLEPSGDQKVVVTMRPKAR